MIHKRARVSLLATVLAAGVIAPAVATGPGAAAAPAANAPLGPTVTLLTGDKVTLGGPNGARVQAGPGREHLGFRATKDERGDIHVVPDDALAPLAAGRLDPRLFDVTELARTGYADDTRAKLPLIVDYRGAPPQVASAQVTRELPAMSAAAVEVDRTPAYWPTARDQAAKVWLDGPVEASLDHSVPQIGAPDAWAAGYTGEGATVAVLDTGIDATHPDLTDAVASAKNFTDSASETDNFGHGTHVASIITGSGAAEGGKYKGVAPDAKLLNGKVLGDDGSGQESWIIAGMEWAATSGADVINMSLGSPFPSDGTDPMSAAVNRLTAETGALFVIAAGNSGPGAESIGSPGAADAALTVGAVDRDDKLADFSSRGPRTGDGAIKPDITAPGVGIVAAKAKNSVIGEPVGDDYLTLSGTSMATPHVAGAAAILAAQHKDWTATQLKATLMGSAKGMPDQSVFEQGAGRVDVAAAVNSTLSVSPSSLSLGTVQWPHDDDQPIAKTLTYTNSGSAPVTVDVAADINGPDGSPAPQGMFTVEPAQLTVPAGGTATATVTTNTKVDSADGGYTGAVTAKAGDQVVRAPLAVTREVESYDVKVSFLDHDGKPTEKYSFQFVNLANPAGYSFYDESGTVVARVPKGEFYFEAWVQTQRSETRYLTSEVAEPTYRVDGPGELVVDARKSRSPTFQVDKPNARTGAAVMSMIRKTAWGDTGVTAFLPDFADHLVVPSTTSAGDDFTYTAEARMAEPNGETYENSPYLYNVRHTNNDGVPAEQSWRIHDRDLAKVTSTYAVVNPDRIGVREQFLSFKLPNELTEFYTPDTPWTSTFFEMTAPDAYPPSIATDQLDGRVYRKGKTVTEQWNKGVFGPAFPKNPFGEGTFAGRLGNLVAINLPLTSDQVRGRAGRMPATGTTTLLLDGQVVGEVPYAATGRFTVPAANGKYTLRTDATHDSRLSTHVSGEWTFASGHVSDEDVVSLPLLAVRYAPKLDDHNAAPAGREFSFPVYVERNDQKADRANAPAVEVSYDDGKTWRPTRVTRDHDAWRAAVTHPADAQFVSLRSKVTDKDGNTASTTILRAYALK